MPGYIENSVVNSLWGSYNIGRAGPANFGQTPIKLGQWSAAMDAATCDWCGWADERIFDPKTEPYEPPVHFGCRCIIGYILAGEFGGTPDWGKGPPKNTYPPGSSGGCTPLKGIITLADNPVQICTPASVNVPPKTARVELNPNRKILDKVTEEWSEKFSFDEAQEVSDMKAFRNWHNKSLKNLTRESIESQQEFTAAKKVVNEFFQDWSKFASKEASEFLENALAGKLDEMTEWLLSPRLKWGINAQSAVNSGKVSVDAISAMFRAQQELTVAVARVQGQEIILYRGVKVTTKGERTKLLKGFIDRLGDGDFEQALGTEFVESWTTKKDIARYFAEPGAFDESIVFKKAISVDDLIVDWKTNPEFQRHMTEAETLWANLDGTLVPKVLEIDNGVSLVTAW